MLLHLEFARIVAHPFEQLLVSHFVGVGHYFDRFRCLARLARLFGRFEFGTLAGGTKHYSQDDCFPVLGIKVMVVKRIFMRECAVSRTRAICAKDHPTIGAFVGVAATGNMSRFMPGVHAHFSLVVSGAIRPRAAKRSGIEPSRPSQARSMASVTA